MNFAKKAAAVRMPAVATSTSDMYTLTIKDIKGNLLLSGPEKTGIICTSWNIGIHMPMQGDVANAERASGRAVFTDLVLTKMCDISTPALYKACAAADNLTEAKLHIGRTTAGNYLALMTYVLTNPMISSITTGGSGEGDMPMETLTLNFSKITLEYVQQGIDTASPGKDSFGWDLATNMAA